MPKAGEGDLNPTLGPVVVSDLQAGKYFLGRDLGDAAKVNLETSRADTLFGARVKDSGIEDGFATGVAQRENWPARYRVSVELKNADGSTSTAKLFTNQGVLTTGIPDLGLGKFEAQSQKFLAEEVQKTESTPEGSINRRIQTGQQFLESVGKLGLPRDFARDKETLIVGAGDSAYVVLEQLYGSPAAPDIKNTTFENRQQGVAGKTLVASGKNGPQNLKDFLAPERLRYRYQDIGGLFRGRQNDAELTPADVVAVRENPLNSRLRVFFSDKLGESVAQGLDLAAKKPGEKVEAEGVQYEVVETPGGKVLAREREVDNIILTSGQISRPEAQLQRLLGGTPNAESARAEVFEAAKEVFRSSPLGQKYNADELLGIVNRRGEAFDILVAPSAEALAQLPPVASAKRGESINVPGLVGEFTAVSTPAGPQWAKLLLGGVLKENYPGLFPALSAAAKAAGGPGALIPFSAERPTASAKPAEASSAPDANLLRPPFQYLRRASGETLERVRSTFNPTGDASKVGWLKFNGSLYEVVDPRPAGEASYRPGTNLIDTVNGQRIEYSLRYIGGDRSITNGTFIPALDQVATAKAAESATTAAPRVVAEPAQAAAGTPRGTNENGRLELNEAGVELILSQRGSRFRNKGDPSASPDVPVDALRGRVRAVDFTYTDIKLLLTPSAEQLKALPDPKTVEPGEAGRLNFSPKTERQRQLSEARRNSLDVAEINGKREWVQIVRTRNDPGGALERTLLGRLSIGEGPYEVIPDSPVTPVSSPRGNVNGATSAYDPSKPLADQDGVAVPVSGPPLNPLQPQNVNYGRQIAGSNWYLAGPTVGPNLVPKESLADVKENSASIFNLIQGSGEIGRRMAENARGLEIARRYSAEAAPRETLSVTRGTATPARAEIAVGPMTARERQEFRPLQGNAELLLKLHLTAALSRFELNAQGNIALTAYRESAADGSGKLVFEAPTLPAESLAKLTKTLQGDPAFMELLKAATTVPGQTVEYSIPVRNDRNGNTLSLDQARISTYSDFSRAF